MDFGLPRPCPSAFQGVDWCTDQVETETVLRLRLQRVVPDLLDPLSDNDTIDDWARWMAARHSTDGYLASSPNLAGK